jgi:hypothetical protein
MLEERVGRLESAYENAMIMELRARVASLEEQVGRLEENSVEQVIVLREITREEAKTEIIDIFASGETLYYSDISERLRIDLEVVVEICRELQAEGVIRVDDDAV